MRLAYLDASAFVKLFKVEVETRALREALEPWAVWVSSELLAVEARCTARRLGDEDVLRVAETALTGIDLVSYTAGIAERAGASSFSPALRALDAIHLATAIELGEDLGVFLAYDEELRAAAAHRGLPVGAPAAQLGGDKP